MKVKLIPVGNSKGIRIPKSVIEACGFGDQIEMRVGDGIVTLTPAPSARAAWDAAFERMAAAGDDAPLVPDRLEHSWDAEEWEW